MDDGSTDTAVFRAVTSVDDVPRQFLRLQVGL
jgi:hypothetical protein